MKTKNKDYLTLANERHEQNKAERLERRKVDKKKIAIELAKLEAQERRAKHSTIIKAISIISSLLFIVVLICVVLAVAKR